MSIKKLNKKELDVLWGDVDYALPLPPFLDRTREDHPLYNGGKQTIDLNTKIGTKFSDSPDSFETKIEQSIDNKDSETQQRGELSKLTSIFKDKIARDVIGVVKKGNDTFGKIRKALKKYTDRELKSGINFAKQWLTFANVKGHKRLLKKYQQRLISKGRKYSVVRYEGRYGNEI